MVVVEIARLSKNFGDTEALRNFSLKVDGGIVTLLGPSGCGKTTALRCLAGMEVPDSGTIKIGDRIIVDKTLGILVPPYKRDIGFVMQDYALWPHMKVFENVAFGLRMRKTPDSVIKEKVNEALKLVGLEGTRERYPFQLSGGEQQRIALARSIVYDPKLMILDEPLSNIDAKLKESVSVELRRILRALGITTITVTHDQEEAFNISDRIAIMNKGELVQEGTPVEMYEKPKNEFVMGFIGRSNVFRGSVSKRNGSNRVVVKSIGADLICNVPEEMKDGEDCLVGIKSNELSINLDRPESMQNVIEGTEISKRFLGATTTHRVRAQDAEILITTHKFCLSSADDLNLNQKVFIHVPPGAVTLSPS
jgi:iron(III) transport system ATP-binding protein